MHCSIFILLLQTGSIFAHKHKLHESMTPGEVQDIFGTSHENVPDYDIVPVSHGLHRDNNERRIVQLTSFEEDITLYLKPVGSSLASTKTPVYRAQVDNSTAEQKIIFKKVPQAIKSSHTFFQDPLHMAALLIKLGKDGLALLNGVIDKLAIRPLPHRFREQFKKENQSANQDECSNSTLKNTHHHIVFRTDSSKVVENEITPLQPNLQQNDTNEVPPVIHPQLLIVMESTLFNKFNQDNDKAVEYLLAFWNAVDLRYRAFLNPEINLNIAGIILSENEAATPFIANNQIEISGQEHNKINVISALRNMSQFLFPYTLYNEEDKSLTFEELNFEYDVAVTLTTYDMCQFAPRCLNGNKFICSPRPKFISSSCLTLGLAYFTGACSYDSNESLMESVAIVEDQGAFAAIIPTAHELGHLLGASHRETTEQNCPMYDGYMMSYKLVVSDKSFIWSNCSVTSIKKFLKEKPRAQCLFNNPVTGNAIKRVLPGELYSRDEMCKRVMGTQSCNETQYSESCVKLYCSHTTDEGESCTAVPYHAIPEGAPCGEGSHCINTKCLSKSESKVLLYIGTNTEEADDSS